MPSVLLEVCCGSADDVIQAHLAGADRAELCSDLFHGGLTPSAGSLIVAKRETGLPVVAMIRPREGGFRYTEAEYAVCLEDAETLLKLGADGLVFGFLLENGRIDLARTKRLVSLACDAGREAVFHRAIDVVPDWREAVDQLAELGVTRILTSGQAPDVSEGTETVREMVEYARGRVQIMPGAGITRRNLARVVAETGASQVHVAASSVRYDRSADNNRAIFYGGCLYPPEDRYSMTDREAIRAMAAALK